LKIFFSPKALADNFKNSNCVEYSGFGVISLGVNENFIQKMLPCLLAWMAKVAWLSNRALKNAIFTSNDYSVINQSISTNQNVPFLYSPLEIRLKAYSVVKD